jgi:FkbM family methyltransferase
MMLSLDKLKEELMAYSGPKEGEMGQDILALLLYGFKTGGFFVEFGAFNGKSYSNTYILEKNYNWTGILAEPGKVFHKELFANRSAKIDTRAVADVSGKYLTFKETDDHLGLSGIVEHVYNNNDMHVDRRKNSLGNTYLVETVSLSDLLREHQAPKFIEYLSLDTEGSEPIILEKFDFSTYKIGYISVEHNFVESARNKIYNKLINNGYQRILTDVSKYDDWYILIK